MRQVYQSR